ncbi:MAG: 3',5'-cyclic-nucleotide phosphodiesterase [Burkholderiaceae bacterium]
MKLKVLGCSGGIGAGLRTTSFLLDNDVLIDAGTGVQDLTIDELAAIDSVFLTHSHLDHVASLPLLIDSVGSVRENPVVVHALPETIEALKQHIFNWTIWPDFTQIPSPEKPYLVYQPLSIGRPIILGKREIWPLRANHTVPALGFHLKGESGSLVFSGDTAPNPGFWAVANQIIDLRHLIIETAFSNEEKEIAVKAKHLYPDQLVTELNCLQSKPQVWITHLKPLDQKTISDQVTNQAAAYSPTVLDNGITLEF